MYIAPHKLHMAIVRRWLKATLCLLGFKVTVKGTPVTEDGVLFVSNHCSYMDVLVMGANVTVYFTPKKDVRSWPFINILVALSKPLYIDRMNRNTLSSQMQQIRGYINNDRSIVLYPEGTTDNGYDILPFKSSLFGILDDGDINVQPVTIIYPRCGKSELKKDKYSPIAWVGDMSLVPHLWGLFKNKDAEAIVIFHEFAEPSEFESRKDIANYCQSVIQKPFEEYR